MVSAQLRPPLLRLRIAIIVGIEMTAGIMIAGIGTGTTAEIETGIEAIGTVDSRSSAQERLSARGA